MSDTKFPVARAVAILVRTAALLLAIFVLQSTGFALSEQLGVVTVWLSIALLLVTSWVAGSGFPGRWKLAAAAFGLGLALIYFQLDWLFLEFFLVDVLRVYTEEAMRWNAPLYALLLWPTALLCAVAAVAAAGRRDRREVATRGRP